MQRKCSQGNALIEVALMAPWIFFLFVGVLDFGFYAYSFISTENAARAAALLTSKGKAVATDQTDACTIVLAELKWAAYGRSLPSDCSSAPLIVTATLLNNSSSPKSLDGTDATQIEVKYTTLTMIPIPGLLASSFVVDRKWQMKVDPSSDF